MGNLFDRPFLLDNSGALLSDWKWIIDNGTTTTAEDWVTNGTNTVYTVPANKVYYVTYLSLTFASSAAAAMDASAQLNDKKIIDITTVDVDNLFGFFPVNLNMPAKLTAGQTVKTHSSNANLRVSVSVTGYLLDA